MFFSYLLLIFWTFVVLFPFYWMATTAFKLPIDVSTGPKYIPFVDYKPVLNAWYEMKDFLLRPYVNTVVVGLVSSVITLLIGAFAAYALVRFEYRPKPGLVGVFILCGAVSAILMLFGGIHWILAVLIGLTLFAFAAATIGKRFSGTLTNNDIAFWLISQRMLPPIVVVLPIFMMFQKLQLLDTQAALIIVYTGANLPLAIWFMRDFFLSIPLELEESAFIDGASRFQVLRRIILPLSVPGLVATFLIILIFAWNEFIFAQFLSRANSQTMPVLVSAQNATRGPQWWNISLLVLFMVTPIVIMAIVLERFIARGLLMGAVKG
ncbi:MAG: carbohydrate ABC transporter permease [Chloroflexi bacterium]|nr:MAG: carbohydrate ABC transporter permease [Chloroflexota bacterium]